jgi:hypothetical protein
MPIDPKSLESIQDAVQSKAKVFLSSNTVEYVFETTLLSVLENRLRVENRVKPEFITAFTKGERFSLQVEKMRLESSSVASDGEHIVFPLEDMRLLDETRQSERFPFAAEEQVICEFVNPWDGETRIRKTVMDMSAQGLSLRTTGQTLLFSPGTVIKDMMVLIAGKPYTRVTGQPVYQRKLFDRSGNLKLQVGIKFLKPGEQPT